MSTDPRSQSDEARLRGLSQINIPEASAAARQRALDAAMLAFDAEAASKASPAQHSQGRAGGRRLSSILRDWRKAFAMDLRIPIGATAAALLVLPLGWQLYTSTSLTGLPPVAMRDAIPPVPLPRPVEQIAATKLDASPLAPDDNIKGEGRLVTVVPLEADEGVLVGDDALANRKTRTITVRPDGSIFASEANQANEPRSLSVTRPEAAQLGSMADADGGAVANMDAERNEMFAGAAASPPPMAEGLVAPSVAPRLAAAAPSPSQPMLAPEKSGDVFAHYADSPVKQVKTDPVSTFSVDVDTASYSYVRRMLEQGVMPSPDAVRVEEMINYFPYDYMPPPSADVPFTPWVTVLPSPWNAGRQLVHIGIKGYEPPADTDVATNLVFLLDTSGSMDEPDKLPLLKRAFSLLVEQLSANDTVSIVAYAGSAGVVLEPTAASDKAKILAALDRLEAGGSTAGAEGIELAYRLAEQSKVAGGVNRVILATDGDFNVGISDPEELKTFIKSKRDEGVFLSVLGFGQGNLDDETMQALAQNGNGNASYIDSFREAQKVLVAQGGATLAAIAKDVKIQVEFNAALVSEYRLVGYESRALNREDFNNDKVDAGDVGAGHTVTAIYEITPVGAPSAIDPLRYEEKPAAAPTPLPPDAEIGFVKLRYKLPNETQSRLLDTPIRADSALPEVNNAVEDVRFAAAVAGFAQKLKGSDFVADTSWRDIRALAQGGRGDDESGYRAEFLQLVDAASAISPGGEDVPCSIVNGERVCR